MPQAVAILMILLMLFFGAWRVLDGPSVFERLGLIEQEEVASDDPVAQKEAVAPLSPQEAPGLLPDKIKSGVGAGSPFDVAKISPDGISVFAGQAWPQTVVTVLADGQPIGTATSDANGEWVLIVERPFSNTDPKLSVTFSPTEAAPASADGIRTVQGVSGSPARGGATTVAAATAQIMDDLQRRVDRARVEAKARGEGSEPLPVNGEAEKPIASPSTSVDQGSKAGREKIGAAPARKEEVAVAKSNHGSDAPAVKNEADSVPVPLKFVFREATLTEEGRRAADLLLEYLLLRQLPSVTLTGHADERGTPAFNLSLSAERLQTVANFLRAGGYAGKLTLIPKGDTEPFTGVDRHLFPREDLYDLDRRVELRLPTQGSAADL
jgi:outer membrane protein OmpA-like peptidoglycan-associated protein